MKQDIAYRALELLVENRKLNKKSLARAERESVETGRPVEQVVVESGEVDRTAFLQAASLIAGVPSFNLQVQKVSFSRAQMISRQVADQVQAIPVSLENGKLTVVMADPKDTFAVERIATLTGLEVEPRVTYNPDIPPAIEKAFSVKVDRITADTPHGAAQPAETRSPGMRFATATRGPELDVRLRNSVVQNLGTSRSVKIDGFVTAKASPAEGRLDTPQEKLEFLERNLIALTEPGDFKTRMQRILTTARAVCHADGASLLLLSEDRTELYFAAAVGSRAEELLKIRLPLNEHSVAGFSVLHRNTLRVNDAATDPRQSKATDAAINYRTRSLIASPVSWEGEPVGVLEVVNKVDGSFDDDDVEFMQVLAVQAAVASVLSRSSDAVRTFRREAVEALRTMLETSGLQLRHHGELVCRVATALGRELKLSPHELERLELASYIHDVGLLGGAEGHAARGADTVGRISALADLVPVIRHHHEHFDGSGGPDHLEGDRIPRMARLLAMAEAWIEGLERLGLHRRNDVLHEILAACGSRYDPALKIPFEIAVNAVTPAG